LIGTLGEKNLHSALKTWYARAGDQLEAEVDGFHIDIDRHKGWSIFDHRLIEGVRKHLFKKPADFMKLVPRDLSEPFTTRDLANGIAQPHWHYRRKTHTHNIMDQLCP